MASRPSSRGPTPDARDDSDSTESVEDWVAEDIRHMREQIERTTEYRHDHVDRKLREEVLLVEDSMKLFISKADVSKRVTVAGKLLLKTAELARVVYDTTALVPPFKLRHEDAVAGRYNKTRKRKPLTRRLESEELEEVTGVVGRVELPLIENNESHAAMIQAAGDALQHMEVTIMKNNKPTQWSPDDANVVQIISFIFLRVFDVEGLQTANELIRAGQTQPDASHLMLLRTAAASAKVAQLEPRSKDPTADIPRDLHFMYAAFRREATLATQISTPIGRVAYLNQKAEVVRLYDTLLEQLGRNDGDAEGDALKLWVKNEQPNHNPAAKRNKNSIRREFKVALAKLLYPDKSADASYVAHTINRGRVVHDFIQYFGPGILVLLPGDTAQRWDNFSPTAIRHCIETCMNAYYDINPEDPANVNKVRRTMVEAMLKKLNTIALEPLLGPERAQSKSCDARHIPLRATLSEGIEVAFDNTQEAKEKREQKDKTKAKAASKRQQDHQRNASHESDQSMQQHHIQDDADSGRQ